MHGNMNVKYTTTHCAELNVIHNSYPGMNIICRMETELHRITGGGSYTGLTSLILTLKYNSLSIFYQLHQNRLVLK
jgi:hypothetical protein